MIYYCRTYYSAVTVNHVLALDNNSGQYDFATTQAELAVRTPLMEKLDA